MIVDLFGIIYTVSFCVLYLTLFFVLPSLTFPDFPYTDWISLTFIILALLVWMMYTSIHTFRFFPLNLNTKYIYMHIFSKLKACLNFFNFLFANLDISNI